PWPGFGLPLGAGGVGVVCAGASELFFSCPGALPEFPGADGADDWTGDTAPESFLPLPLPFPLPPFPWPFPAHAVPAEAASATASAIAPNVPLVAFPIVESPVLGRADPSIGSR